jgi:organic radical activating enzyme
MAIKSSFLSVDWCLGNYCNFSCHYCFPDSNTGTHKPPKVDNILKDNIIHLVNNIRKFNTSSQILWNFAGGEPTIYKDFEVLLSFIKEINNNSCFTMVSNGSRSPAWWKKNAKFFKQLNLSYHPTQTNNDHFKNVIKELSTIQDLDVYISISIDGDLEETSFSILLDLCSFINTFPFSNIGVNMTHLRETCTYFPKKVSEEYQKKITDFLSSDPIKNRKHYNKDNDSTYIVFKDEKEEYNTWKMQQFSGSWNGYTCLAPTQFIQIYHTGLVGYMSCGHKYTTISNIFNEDFKNNFLLSNSSIICQQTRCGCRGLEESSKYIV